MLKAVDKIPKREAVHQIVARAYRVSVDKRKDGGGIYDCWSCLKRSRWQNVCRFVVECFSLLPYRPRYHLTDLLVHAGLLFEHHSTLRLNAGVKRLGDLSTPENVGPQLGQNGLFVRLHDRRQLTEVP